MVDEPNLSLFGDLLFGGAEIISWIWLVGNQATCNANHEFSLYQVRSPCKEHLKNVKLAFSESDGVEHPIKREIEAMVKVKSANLSDELKVDYYAGFSAAKQLTSAMEIAGIHWICILITRC